MRHASVDPPESSSSFSEASFNRMAQALLARQGFAGVAAIASELVGARVEILVPRPRSTGVDGTLVERFVAQLVAGGLPPWPPGVTEVVPIVVGGDVQGAVVVSGELGEGAEEHLQSAARAALTGIAILDTREEARRDQASGLIADLIAGRRLRAGEVAGRAGRLGCDLDGGFVAPAIDGQPARGGGEVAAVVAAVHPSAVVEVVNGIVHALVPGPTVDTTLLEERLGGAVLRAHSGAHDDPADAFQALDEARCLLALIPETDLTDTDRPTWDSIRIMHSAYFNDPARTRSFAERTVGALIRHDETEAGRLQATFWAYQEANCNMNVAAERLETHRHTVANRLRRIRELTGLDPQRGFERELLAVGLRTHLVIVNSAPRPA
ncbi:MAG TPA: helix-turn-helix domain-containing protein [Solirubrobacterales bacterium]|nr:helix-turn-helix domain-containing protein [Solirubrobacterales bacterium]